MPAHGCWFLPYTREPFPDASVLTIPPIVCAITRRKLRGKKDPAGSQLDIELIENNPRFNPRPSLPHIHLYNPVHMPGEVDHHPFGQRLAVRSRSPTTGGKRYRGKLIMSGKLEDALDVRL